MQGHTETELSEHITSNKKTNRRSGKEFWLISSKGANKEINKRIQLSEWCNILC